MLRKIIFRLLGAALLAASILPAAAQSRMKVSVK